MFEIFGRFYVRSMTREGKSRQPVTSTTGLQKIFIQRDFSQGTAVQFQTKFPQELEGRVSNVILRFFTLGYGNKRWRCCRKVAYPTVVHIHIKIFLWSTPPTVENGSTLQLMWFSYWKFNSLKGVRDQLNVFTLNFLLPRKEFLSSYSFERLKLNVNTFNWSQTPFTEFLLRS